MSGLSKPRLIWWNDVWRVFPDGSSMTRKQLLMFFLDRVPHSRNETAAEFACHSRKGMFDGEPGQVLDLIVDRDKSFFKSYPGLKKPMTSVTMKAEIGRAASMYFRGGIPAHPKPNF